VIAIVERGPFRYSVLDGTGAISDAFGGRRSAERAARMLALGARYDPDAVLGARVFPLSAPRRVEYGSGLCSASHVVSGEA
jgi:hypothetical protein